MGKYIFGVDIGGMTVKIGLFSEGGELLCDWGIKTRTENNGENILPDIADDVFKKADAKKISKHDIIGIGLTAPGPVMDDGTINGAVNINWGRFNIVSALRGLTGVDIKAGNDANVAALGEIWRGGGMGYSSAMMVTLGTGVGGGLILNGKIYNGANGAAAEIGHIPFKDIEEEPDICGCGKRGCFEQYCSAKGVLRTAKRYLASHPQKQCALRDDPDFTSKDIFDLAKSGDETACEITKLIYRDLARGMAIISAVVDVEAFVIGGGMSTAGEMLIDGIKRYYGSYAFPATRGVAFKLAKLGNKAGIYGAAKMFIK